MQQLTLDEKIILSQHQKKWKNLYKEESARLKHHLGNKLIAIEHIGSTSIPGIYAKPIIDIMVGIKSLDDAGAIITELEKLNYNYLAQANVKGRLYFRK